jgi:hypothetical protein
MPHQPLTIAISTSKATFPRTEEIQVLVHYISDSLGTYSLRFFELSGYWGGQIWNCLPPFPLTVTHEDWRCPSVLYQG